MGRLELTNKNLGPPAGGVPVPGDGRGPDAAGSPRDCRLTRNVPERARPRAQQGPAGWDGWNSPTITRRRMFCARGRAPARTPSVPEAAHTFFAWRNASVITPRYRAARMEMMPMTHKALDQAHALFARSPAEDAHTFDWTGPTALPHAENKPLPASRSGLFWDCLKPRLAYDAGHAEYLNLKPTHKAVIAYYDSLAPSRPLGIKHGTRCPLRFSGTARLLRPAVRL